VPLRRAGPGRSAAITAPALPATIVRQGTSSNSIDEMARPSPITAARFPVFGATVAMPSIMIPINAVIPADHAAPRRQRDAGTVLPVTRSEIAPATCAA
jgi:hypothetical protein